MKKVLKTVSFSLAIMLVMLAFAGCGKSTPTPSASPQATQATPTGTITMGTNAQFPPFEFVEDKGLVDGQYSGIDVEIAMAIAKETNKTLKISNMSFDSLLTDLPNGKMDFVAAGMTATPERRQSVDFSDTYYVAVQGIIVPANSTIKSASDLTNKKVGAIVGYTGETLCKDELKLKNVSSFKTGVDAVMELKNGKLDAVVIDLQPAKTFVQKNPDLKVVEDSSFKPEEYAIAVKKGNTELLATINKVIADLKSSGKLDEIVAKYNIQ